MEEILAGNADAVVEASGAARGLKNTVPPTRDELLSARDAASTPDPGGHSEYDRQLEVYRQARHSKETFTPSWEEEMAIGKKACQGSSFEMLTTGPTDEETALLADKSHKIARTPGMTNPEIRARIEKRDEATKAICNSCVVKVACLGLALAEPGVRDGPVVRGGTTLQERNRIRRAGSRARAT